MTNKVKSLQIKYQQESLSHIYKISIKILRICQFSHKATLHKKIHISKVLDLGQWGWV